MIYKGFRIEQTKSGLSVMVWKGENFLNQYNSISDAKDSIDKGELND